jgi:hypothetical protein
LSPPLDIASFKIDSNFEKAVKEKSIRAMRAWPFWPGHSGEAGVAFREKPLDQPFYVFLKAGKRIHPGWKGFDLHPEKTTPEPFGGKRVSCIEFYLVPYISRGVSQTGFPRNR